MKILLFFRTLEVSNGGLPVNVCQLIYYTIWTASSEFGTYSLCEQRRFRRACASAQSRQNLRCSLIQAVSQEEPSDRKSDPWPLWIAGHAQLKFVMTECSKTQIRLTGLIYSLCMTLPYGTDTVLHCQLRINTLWQWEGYVSDSSHIKAGVMKRYNNLSLFFLYHNDPVFGQTGPCKQCRPRSGAVWSGFYTVCHSICILRTQYSMIKTTMFKSKECYGFFCFFFMHQNAFDFYANFLKICTNNCCNYPKIWTVWFYQILICPKDADGLANSVDPDQTVPAGADQSGCTLFAQTCLTEILG